MGLVSLEGIIPVSKYFDTAGPMAKSVRDLANLLDVLVDPTRKKSTRKYAQSIPGKWSDLRVGVLDPDIWYFDVDLQRPVASATEQIVRFLCYQPSHS